jgi:hypothetical protein
MFSHRYSPVGSIDDRLQFLTVVNTLRGMLRAWTPVGAVVARHLGIK